MAAGNLLTSATCSTGVQWDLNLPIAGMCVPAIKPSVAFSCENKPSPPSQKTYGQQQDLVMLHRSRSVSLVILGDLEFNQNVSNTIKVPAPVEGLLA